MMKEAFCNYETVKLLKEKGFDGEMNHFISHHNNDGTSEAVTTCTHQLACTWLREVHNLFILVGWNPIHKEYFTRIINITGGCPKRNIYEYTNYEDAVESAIKYCLENLI